MEEAKENEVERFVNVCDDLKEEILLDLKKAHKMPEEAIEWIEEMIEYNCKGGKMNRGLSVIHCLQVIAKSDNKRLSKDEERNAATLGWCIEWLQAFFLVADDVMDESVTRRGQPCWYRVPKVKQIAINDAFLLESFVFQILKRHFKSSNVYVELIELFRDVIYQTELGQLLDLTSQPMNNTTVDLERFTPERYRNIVVFKTAYYTFYLPAAAAMHLAGITSSECFDIAKNICVAIGEYFQVQDDYLDCYGAPEVIGKVGTDIQDSKCSWLVVQALECASDSQRSVLTSHYGKNTESDVDKIKSLYNELDLPSRYHDFEARSIKEINGLIASIDTEIMNPDVFTMLVNKIYKRSK